MRRIAILVGLTACSWADSITHMGPLPDPAGPCLQIVHPGLHRWRLYRGSAELGGDGVETFEQAMADDPDALALLHDHDRDERIAMIIGVAAGLLGLATVAISAGREPYEGIGFATGVAGYATSGLLAGIADHRWGEAVEQYNRRARTRGCQ